MLTTIITNVVIALLSALGGWLAKVFHIYMQDKKEAAPDEAKTAQITKELQDAQNAADLEKAAQDAANNFGK